MRATEQVCRRTDNYLCIGPYARLWEWLTETEAGN